MARRMQKDNSRQRTRRDPEITEKRKTRSLAGTVNIAPNDYDLLQRFVTEHGKIMPGRSTCVTAKQQRQIKKAVRRARGMGLLA